MRISDWSSDVCSSDLGLQEGTTYLSPSDERRSLFINGHQDLTPDLTLSAVLYNTSRDAESKIFQPFDARESTSTATTDQRGGTLALDWRVGDNGAGTPAQPQSRLAIDRRNFSGHWPCGLQFETTAPSKT